MTSEPPLTRPRARTRGVTLIEAVLFISIALGLIVGGIVFSQQASLTARVNEQMRVMSAIVQEVRALALHNSGNVQTMGLATDDWLIAAQKVPATIIADSAGPYSGSLLRTAWETEMQVTIGGGGVLSQSLSIRLYDVPVGACTRLIPVDVEGRNLYVDGVGRVNLLAQPYSGTNSRSYYRPSEPYGQGVFPITPSDAAAYCAAMGGASGILRVEFNFNVLR